MKLPLKIQVNRVPCKQFSNIHQYIRSSIFIRPVKPSDVEPLLDMLLARGQFNQDGLHHVQKTLTHYFSGQSADLWFSAEHLGLAGIAYCASEMMTNDV